jgi:hypothetical protein
VDTTVVLYTIGYFATYGLTIPLPDRADRGA